MLQSHLHYPVISRDIPVHISMKSNFPQFPLLKNLFSLRKVSVHSNLIIFKAGKLLFHSETTALLTLSTVCLFIATCFLVSSPHLSDPLLSLTFIQRRQHEIIQCQPASLHNGLWSTSPDSHSVTHASSGRPALQGPCAWSSDSHCPSPCAGAETAERWPADVSMFTVPTGFVLGGSECFYHRNKTDVSV